MQLSLTFTEKLRSEFANFESDSTIMVTCRAKFKGEEEENLLPYSIPYLGGIKHYFFTVENGKAKIFFHDSSVCDFAMSGGSGILPMEQISFNFTNITFE